MLYRLNQWHKDLAAFSKNSDISRVYGQAKVPLSVQGWTPAVRSLCGITTLFHLHPLHYHPLRMFLFSLTFFDQCICGYAPKNAGRNGRATDVKVLKG